MVGFLKNLSAGAIVPAIAGLLFVVNVHASELPDFDGGYIVLKDDSFVEMKTQKAYGLKVFKAGEIVPTVRVFSEPATYLV